MRAEERHSQSEAGVDGNGMKRRATERQEINSQVQKVKKYAQIPLVPDHEGHYKELMITPYMCKGINNRQYLMSQIRCQ
jgi:hypothetical protein